MKNIVIAYHTGFGHTKKLVEHVLEGAHQVESINAEMIDVALDSDLNWDKFHQADAIIFASPTYMGSVSGPFKSFMDKTSEFWLDLKWHDKIAAGLTVSSSPSGDKLSTLIQMSVFAAQHGMIWVSHGEMSSLHTGDGRSINDSGSWLGLMATSDQDKSKLISEADAKTASLFGKRVAEATNRWGEKKR